MTNTTLSIATLSTLIALGGAVACTQAVTDVEADEPAPAAEPIVGDDHATDTAAEEVLIEPELIQTAMRGQYMNEAKGCYEALLADQVDAAGKVVLRFAIIDGGATEVTVETAAGNLSQETFHSCLSAALKTVSFPVADGRVKVSYPLVFSDDA